MAQNLPAKTDDARDEGSMSGLGRSPGGGNGNPLQYSCLGNPVDRGAWWGTVHWVADELDTIEQLNTNTKYSIRVPMSRPLPSLFQSSETLFS